MHPKKLGRYELVAVLGKGAMGVVYEGRDPNLDRRVAIKTIMVDDLAPAAATDYEERFRTEARSAARLQHPNIVTVYDSDRDGATAFLVMEFIEGEDLKRHLDRDTRFAVPTALRLMQDLLAALDYAHRQGIVHRDVKPANLLIESGGHLKLTDFGVARITGEATRTQGSMIGTLKYMAPEQVQGLKVDARADLFSAAVLAYQLFTGVRPFDGDNDFSIIQQIIGHDPAPPSSLAPDLPPVLDAVMARAMAKDREQRFATTADFSTALQEAFATVGVVAAQVVPLPAPAPAPRTPVQPRRTVSDTDPTVPGAPSAAPGTPRTIPGAPITQELELEYWRAVRDSTDPRELEGFLVRFPEGIYADLARRRLQRLGSDADPDQTVLHSARRVPTRTEPMARADVTAPLAPPSLVRESQSADLDAAAEPKVRDAAGAAAALPLRNRRKAIWLWPALAFLVAGAAAAVMYGQAPAQPESAADASVDPAVQADASAQPASAPVAAASMPLAAGSKPVAAVATSPAAPASRVAAKPSRRAETAAATGSTANPPAANAASEPRHESPAAAVAAAPSAPAAATPRPAAGQSGSRELCKDKVFLMRELCLHDECAKPANQNVSACVRMREEARLREESRVRN